MREKASQAERFAHVVARAWSDDDFKRRLMSNPLEILAEYKLELPPGITQARIVENTSDTMYFVLPAKPSSVQHVSLSSLPIQILDSPCQGHEGCARCYCDTVKCTKCPIKCHPADEGDEQE